MWLFDLLFPEQSEAMSLRNISERVANLSNSSTLKLATEEKNSVHIRHLVLEIDNLRRDNAELALVTVAMMKIIQNVVGLSRDEIREYIVQADKYDGIEDNAVNMERFRQYFILKERTIKKTFNDKQCPACARRTTKKFGTCIYCGWDLKEE